MQEERASNEIPFYKRPWFVALAAFALAWLVFGPADDDGEDLAIPAFTMEDWPEPGVAGVAGFEAEFEGDYEGDYEGEYEGGFVSDEGAQGGFGYDEPGAFRGEAQVGGVPLVSGTIDESGEGNSVFSVDGEVINLP